MNLTDDVLSFWFETLDLTKETEGREIWLKSTPEFDQVIRDQFIDSYEDAAAGRLDDIKGTRAGCLALILLLDQFSRHLFRDQPRAFAADHQAREFSRHAIDQGYDERINVWVTSFFYAPLVHSELLEDQEFSVKLYKTLGHERFTNAAIAHRDATATFGRFPHRNAVLGRKSTREEEEYLKDPPNWAKTAAEPKDPKKKNA